MKPFSRFVGSLHRAGSKSRTCVKLAVKTRNQMNSVLSRHLGESANPELKGEAKLIASVAPNCRTFVDVGANVGNWTELFLSYSEPNCQGLLFEPGEQAFDKLYQRFGGFSNIKAMNQAVSSEKGSASFYEEPRAGEGSSLVKRVTSTSALRKSVRVTTLDSEVEEIEWEFVDYLKVDTEGYDYYVLLGAVRLLEAGRVGLIQFEYNAQWAWANATLAGAFSLLSQYGYSCYLIRSDGLFYLDHDIYGEYFSYSNFVAVHKGKEAWINHLRCGSLYERKSKASVFST